MKKRFLSAVIFLIALISNAQTSYQGKPQIGKAFTFVFNNVENFSKKVLSNADFKGKWIVLDFWTERCAACILRIPKINELQTQYASKVQFVLVGYNCVNCRIKSLYEKFRSKYELKLPIFYDSATFNIYGVEGVPCIMLIDPNGIVRGITSEITSDDLKEMISGDSLTLSSYNERTDPSYDPEKPLLISHNGGDDTSFLYRSILTNWNRSMTYGYLRDNNPNIFEAIGFPLSSLYKIAYFGRDFWTIIDSAFYAKIWPSPILNLNDSSLFTYSYGKKINIYSCSIYFPGRSINKLAFRRLLQKELENYFHFKVVIEDKEMPCYKLVRIDSASLNPRTTGGKNELKDYGLEGFSAKNITMKQLMLLLTHYNNQIPFVNETAIDYNIDISLNCIMTDINALKKELKRFGIDLIISNATMKVLTINKPEN